LNLILRIGSFLYINILNNINYKEEYYYGNIYEIDRIVVGVDTEVHLRQIVKASQGCLESMPNFREHLDARLIKPAAWSELEGG
jgi:hypothetical protein